jgi:hypothetical protein
MILHPLDWQAIAVSENGQNWQDSLGKISRTGQGVFVGALNIARQNWVRFGQGKYGNFNDPLNPPSFENQIKVAEIMYKGLASDPSAWGRAPKYLDGFEGVRLGRVSFPKISELKVYDRVKAQGLALGGSVRKYGVEDQKSISVAKKIMNTLQGPYATSIPVITPRTINLSGLPQVPNKQGGMSTIRSAGFDLTNNPKGPNILLPTVFKNKIDYSKDLIPTINEFQKTGRHLGVYPSRNAATLAASVLHLSEENRVGKVKNSFSKLSLSNITRSAKALKAQGLSNGGYMPKFKKGGYMKFKEGGEVPSILHGGEYVLNAGAVKKYGLAHIEAMNQMRFNVPKQGFSVPQSSFSGNLAGGMTTSTQNVNIYVDNFIGEPEWFNSMMKDYNTTVLPRNQKAAGLESRVISTYSGLNRGN